MCRIYIYVIHQRISNILQNMSAINLNVNCFAVIRVQSLFSWRPGDMTNPQPSFFSFKSIVKNPKMKVRFHKFQVYLKGNFSQNSLNVVMLVTIGTHLSIFWIWTKIHVGRFFSLSFCHLRVTGSPWMSSGISLIISTLSARGFSES